MRRSSPAAVCFLLLVPLACATPDAKPADMTEKGHAEAAEKHAAEAEAHRAQYDPDATATKKVLDPFVAEQQYAGVKGQRWADQQYNPTARHLQDAARHEKMAKDHAKAAAALTAYEEGACAAFSPPVRASCPLLGQLAKVEPLKNGVRLVPKDDVDAQAWHAHILCHLAFANAKGREDMKMCPLGLAGTTATADGNAVELTANDPVVAAQLLELSRQHAD